MTKNHSKWNIQPLKEITQCLDSMRIPINSKDRAKMKGDIPYYGANGEVDRVNKHIFDDELLLLAEDGGNWRKNQECAYIIKGKSWVNNHAHVLRPKGILIKFLESYLNFADLTKYVSGTTRGKLNQKQMNEIPIPVPPLDTQKKIVSIIEKAEELKRKRKEANQFINRISQSLFLKMFGDRPPQSKIGDVTELVSSGATPLGGGKTYLSNGIVFIRSQNVLMNELYLNDVAHISEEIHNKMKRTWLKNGDVLLNITGASLGRVAIYYGPDGKANVNQHVCIIRLDKKRALPEYVSYYLSSKDAQKEIWTIQTGASRQALNFVQVRSLRIYIPTLSEQENFVSAVNRLKKSREKQRESEQEINQLLDSLMYKAFN